MRVSRLAAVLGTVAVAGVLPGAGRPVAGQSVTYHSSAEFHMPGMLGSLISHAAGSGGGGGGTTYYIDGHRMRTDDRDHSTIIDVDAGKIITIYKDKKSYSSMTFDQFADYMRQAEARAKQQMAQAQQQQQQQKYTAASGKPHDDIEWDTQISTDNTGEHQTISGYDAQRQFVTVTMTAKDKTQADSGTLVILMDLWTSTAAPIDAARRAFTTAYAAKARATFEQPARDMGAMLAMNPKLVTAMKEAGKELEKVHGAHLRTTTYIVGVPEGVKFDRNLALSGGGASSSGGGPSLGQAAQGAAVNGAASSGGGHGLFGKIKAAAAAAAQAQQSKQNQQNQKASKPTAQGTLLWFTSELTDIQPSVPPGAFAIPAGYTLIPMPATLPNN